MCGINGITADNESLIRDMNTETMHRGPDASGVFTAPQISLGHNRLSIIDVSERSNQPMHSPDGRYTLVFNGEIYNYKELREQLKSSWNFKTESDTEVLLAGYAQWGYAVLSKLKGIFAFGIWDAQNQELFLARDQMGVKPLYYALKDSVLYFSSELSGAIAGTGYRTLNREALSYYVSLNYVPSPHTMVQGISKLEASHQLTYKNGIWKTERYFFPAAPERSAQGDSNTLRKIIDMSITRQLISDRPVGVLLSGGIDSSIVLHHTAQHTAQMRTFSVDFEMIPGAESEAARFNADARIAEKTAHMYGAQHTKFTLSIKNIQDELDTIFQSFDEPIANPSAVSRYLLSKWVREKGVVVALGGDGGDELFGGYPRYQIALGAYYFHKLPKVVQRGLGLLHPQIQKLTTESGTAMHMKLMALKYQKYASVFTEDFSPVTDEFFRSRYAASAVSALHPIDQFMRVDRESWLADESLAQSDRTSMAHGLELRVPLLDIDIVSYADTLQGTQKFSVRKNKKILRDAYQGVLPDHIFREPKRGWISPGAKWIRDPQIHAYAKNVLSPEYYNGIGDIFNWGGLQAQLTEHVDRRGYHLYPLWNSMLLQVWAKRHSITL